MYVCIYIYIEMDVCLYTYIYIHVWWFTHTNPRTTKNGPTSHSHNWLVASRLAIMCPKDRKVVVIVQQQLIKITIPNMIVS